MERQRRWANKYVIHKFADHIEKGLCLVNLAAVRHIYRDDSAAEMPGSAKPSRLLLEVLLRHTTWVRWRKCRWTRVRAKGENLHCELHF
jgi:hypothetical protein